LADLHWTGTPKEVRGFSTHRRASACCLDRVRSFPADHHCHGDSDQTRFAWPDLLPAGTRGQKRPPVCVDAEKEGPVWASKGDDRTTRVGRIIRKIRVDEIPQFWNILKGEMSFVGPRPERPHFVAQLAHEIPYYEQRHMIAPGLTGWAQIKYPYGASIEDARQKLQYDLFYIKNHGLVFDAIILFETVKIILFGRGAQ
jgi:hypothetical protein